MINLNIICLIADKLDFIDRQRLKHVCRGFYQHIKIKRIEKDFIYTFTDSILKMYPDLERLELHSSPNITSVNHLSSLKELWLSDDRKSILSNEGIQGCLQLEELYLHGNQHITSLNHLKHLREVDIEDTKITDEGIEGCTKLERIWVGFRTVLGKNIRI